MKLGKSLIPSISLYLKFSYLPARDIGKFNSLIFVKCLEILRMKIAEHKYNVLVYHYNDRQFNA